MFINGQPIIYCLYFCCLSVYLFSNKLVLSKQIFNFTISSLTPGPAKRYECSWDHKLGLLRSAIVTGIYKRPARPAATVCTKASTGSPISSRIRSEGRGFHYRGGTNLAFGIIMIGFSLFHFLLVVFWKNTVCGLWSLLRSV